MKVYEKPRISIERFVLSQHVADCGWELQLGDEKSCFATGDSEWGYPSDVRAFLADSVVCEVEPEGYCYTVGSGGVGLFKS